MTHFQGRRGKGLIYTWSTEYDSKASSKENPFVNSGNKEKAQAHDVISVRYLFFLPVQLDRLPRNDVAECVGSSHDLQLKGYKKVQMLSTIQTKFLALEFKKGK